MMTITEHIRSHLAALPGVDELLRHDVFRSLLAQYGRQDLTDVLRKCLDTERRRLIDGHQPHNDVAAHLYTVADESLARSNQSSLKPVINLTGVVLHTNLGRASYPQEAIDAMTAVVKDACNLEMDLSSGKRGKRDNHVRDWICRLTGAQAATTVNNNAAAVLLTLNTLAHEQDVLVSRGELIEIGGSFRMPEIMHRASARLVEVGTTNRTHLKDYAGMISADTAALMKVHTSNYVIQGFTNEVSARELAPLARQHKIHLIDDLGSGSLIDLSHHGLPAERTVAQALDEGVDVVTFSGDKLLGGPQCGIIAGSATLIDAIDRNPMKRALRLDKVTLAALEAVLRMYANPDTLIHRLPTLQRLTKTATQIQPVAAALSESLGAALTHCEVTTQPCYSEIGSGSLPTHKLDSFASVIRIKPDHAQSGALDRVVGMFRELPVPVIGRVYQDALWLDARCLADPQTVVTQLRAI